MFYYISVLYWRSIVHLSGEEHVTVCFSVCDCVCDKSQEHLSVSTASWGTLTLHTPFTSRFTEAWLRDDVQSRRTSCQFRDLQVWSLTVPELYDWHMHGYNHWSSSLALTWHLQHLRTSPWKYSTIKFSHFGLVTLSCCSRARYVSISHFQRSPD